MTSTEYRWSPHHFRYATPDAYAKAHVASFNFILRWLHGPEFYKYGYNAWFEGGTVVSWMEKSDNKITLYRGLVRGDGYVFQHEAKGETTDEIKDLIAQIEQTTDGKYLVDGYDWRGHISFNRMKPIPTFTREQNTQKIIEVK
jgi:hypothetical protein